MGISLCQTETEWFYRIEKLKKLTISHCTDTEEIYQVKPMKDGSVHLAVDNKGFCKPSCFHCSCDPPAQDISARTLSTTSPEMHSATLYGCLY